MPKSLRGAFAASVLYTSFPKKTKSERERENFRAPQRERKAFDLSQRTLGAAYKVLPKSVRPAFAACVLYSDTLSPYTKVGVGVGGMIVPTGIVGPADTIVSLILIADGYKTLRQDYADWKSGAGLKKKHAALQSHFRKSKSRAQIYFLPDDEIKKPAWL